MTPQTHHHQARPRVKQHQLTQPVQARAGALTSPSSCLDGGITRVGPCRWSSHSSLFCPGLAFPVLRLCAWPGTSPLFPFASDLAVKTRQTRKTDTNISKVYKVSFQKQSFCQDSLYSSQLSFLIVALHA